MYPGGWLHNVVADRDPRVLAPSLVLWGLSRNGDSVATAVVQPLFERSRFVRVSALDANGDLARGTHLAFALGSLECGEAWVGDPSVPPPKLRTRSN
jgi:hypothetical protein